MGLSPGPEWLVSRNQILDVVCEFIDAIVPAQRIVIAGHSYGASLARGLMRRHGDRIAGAFLLSPGAPSDAEKEAVAELATVFAEDPQFDAELTEIERNVVDLIRVRTLEALNLLRTQALPGFEAADHAFLARVAAGPEFHLPH